jgi:hypothetical protein
MFLLLEVLDCQKKKKKKKRKPNGNDKKEVIIKGLYVLIYFELILNT